MKIFEHKSEWMCEKTNFVDSNNVLVGFDTSQECCEQYGWFLTKTIEEAKAYPVEGRTLNDDDAHGFVFDPDFFLEHGDSDQFQAGGMVTFRLIKGEEEMFLSLYNVHNGYYSHGFHVSVGGEVIRSGSL